MRSVPKPGIQFTDHFRNCSNATRELPLRDRLLASETAVLAEAAAYEVAGNASTLFALTDTGPTAATDDELRNLYGRSMVRARAIGRRVYDQLKHAAPGGICPLCNQRPVSTLDHYLPKELFPKLAVTPVNLIPCCSDCNRKKHRFSPDTSEEQLLHPYYDDCGNELWLYASVIYEGNTPLVVFHAQPPTAWGASRCARVQNHFTRLGLAQLYSIYGTAEISIVRGAIERILYEGNPADVQSHFHASWQDRNAVNPNSWQAATYFALLNNADICAGHLGPP